MGGVGLARQSSGWERGHAGSTPHPPRSPVPPVCVSRVPRSSVCVCPPPPHHKPGAPGKSAPRPGEPTPPPLRGFAMVGGGGRRAAATATRVRGASAPPRIPAGAGGRVAPPCHGGGGPAVFRPPPSTTTTTTTPPPLFLPSLSLFLLPHGARPPSPPYLRRLGSSARRSPAAIARRHGEERGGWVRGGGRFPAPALPFPPRLHDTLPTASSSSPHRLSPPPHLLPFSPFSSHHQPPPPNLTCSHLVVVSHRVAAAGENIQRVGDLLWVQIVRQLVHQSVHGPRQLLQ